MNALYPEISYLGFSTFDDAKHRNVEFTQ